VQYKNCYLPRISLILTINIQRVTFFFHELTFLNNIHSFNFKHTIHCYNDSYAAFFFSIQPQNFNIMILEMNVTFPGGKKVNAEYKGHIIETDQPIKSGGEDSAPEPFSLFLASIATCAGIYVKSFCDQRNLNSEGIELKQIMNFNMEEKRFDKITIEIALPTDFPEKYKPALINAANLCAVKKHIMHPPDFDIVTIEKKLQ